MATTSAERQALWRGRVALRETFYQGLNTRRIDNLKRTFAQDTRPEVAAVAEFFLNYPRCALAPRAFDRHGNSWRIVLAVGASVYEGAAVAVALSEITSSPFEIEGPDAEWAREEVRTEVSEMRALGLWGRQP
jgi:hypothetical protein